MDQKILAKLLEIAPGKCNDGHVRALTDLNQSVTELFDLDSLALMSFIAAIEEEFQIRFRDDITLAEVNSLTHLVEEIENLRKSGSGLSSKKAESCIPNATSEERPAL